MANELFDVVVVGAGAASENVAGRCAEGGLSVAIVERELVGGDRSYWGCIPSKVLLRPGDVLAAADRVPGAAPAVNGGVDAAATFALRDSFTRGWDDHDALPWLTDRGIEIVRGTGRLAGERAVEVDTADGGTRRLVAGRAVVLAWAPRRRCLPSPGSPRRRHGTTVTPLPLRRCHGGCSFSAVVRSGWRWPRPSGGSEPTRSR